MYLMSTNKDGRGSAGQDRIFEMIQQLYPKYKVIWEQSVPRINARFDIFVKEIGLVVEVDGTQHDTFNPFFHKDIHGLKRGYMKDKNKDTFCCENGIKMVRLNYRDALSITIDNLKDRIENTEYPDGVYTFSCLA